MPRPVGTNSLASTAQPPFVVDVLVASPEDHLVFSYAQRFGPDPWSPEMAERCRIDVQAAELRQKLGLDD